MGLITVKGIERHGQACEQAEEKQDVQVHAFTTVIDFSNQFLKEMGVVLCARIVVSPDVLEVSAVCEGVLGDNVHIASVKVRVTFVFRVNEAFAENKIGGAESAGISASKENSVLIHLGINVKGRCKHIVPVPIAEEVIALFVFGPVVQGRS